MATVRIAQASSDERGKYNSGKAGNQNGRELNTRAWYRRPWDRVLRPINRAVGEQLAAVMLALVNCPKIGYDQHQRTTLWAQCEKIRWDITRLNDIAPCETDCSALVAVALRFCGIKIPSTSVTWTLEKSCVDTGAFRSIKEKKYLDGPNYLQTGDILLNTQHHVAVCLDDGVYARDVIPTPTNNPASPKPGLAAAQTPKYVAVVTDRVKTSLNVRTWAGTEYPTIKSWPRLYAGNLVDVCDVAYAADGSRWYYIRIAGQFFGFVSADYLQRV